MKAMRPYSYITTVKSGKHYVIFDYKDASGKRKRKWIGTGLTVKCSKRSLNQAVKIIISDFETSIVKGNVIIYDNRSPLLRQLSLIAELNILFSEWLSYIKPNTARTTYWAYCGIAERFLEFMNENYPMVTLDTIEHTHVQSFLNYKLDTGCMGSSVKQYYLVLHTAFEYGVKMGLLSGNPMEKLNIPRADRHEATFYNADELNTLFEVFKGDKIELIVHIAAYYGLRRCEILGLKWDAIDFVNKTLSVQRKVVSDYDESGKMQLYVESRLKTYSTRRTLPLIPHIEEMLLERKKAEESLAGTGGTYDGFICRDRSGNLISPDYVTSRFGYMIKKSGLRHLRFHDMRHSCASLLLAHDIPMKEIQEWLGHSNYTVTANLYSHLEYNAKVNSAETISRALGRNDGRNES